MERLKVEKFILDEETKKYRNDLFLNIKKDKELLSYLTSIGVNNDELIKNNLTDISLYQKDFKYCKNCPGFLLCNKKYPHYQVALSIKGNYLDKSLTPCKLKIEDEAKDKMYIIRDFPASWRNASLITLDKSKVRLPVIKKYKEALESKRNWIFINGINRSGKSYISVALLNGFIDKYHQEAIFLNYPTRIRDLQDLSFNNKEQFVSTINLYSRIPILVLDDFGNEYKNEYIRDTITLAILSERARLGLVTIFTSELTYDDIENMYSINASGRARGKQIRRLIETFAGDAIDVTTAAIY